MQQLLEILSSLVLSKDLSAIYLFKAIARERTQTAARKFEKKTRNLFRRNVALIFPGGLSIPRLFSIESTSRDDEQPSKRRVSGRRAGV